MTYFDDFLISYIGQFVSLSTRMNMRGVCRAWKRAISCEPADHLELAIARDRSAECRIILRQIEANPRAGELVARAAARAIGVARDTFAPRRGWDVYVALGNPQMSIYEVRALGYNARHFIKMFARAGSIYLCGLIEPYAGSDLMKYIYAAAEVGRRSVCEWAAWDRKIDGLDTMLYYAARGGHLDLCDAALAWGACDADRMLYGAARAGRATICEAARARGARDFDGMLRFAARGGHRAICDLAVSWGARDFRNMLIVAAGHGKEDMCLYAVRMGARNISEMCDIAHQCGHPGVVDLIPLMVECGWLSAAEWAIPQGEL